MRATFTQGQLVGLAMIDGLPRQTIAAPVMAPHLLGWIVFAPRIDKQQMDGLQELAHMPLRASLIVRDAAGRWVEAPGHHAFGKPGSGSDSAADLSPLTSGSSEIFGHGETSFFAAKALATLRGERPAALLLLYPKSRALAVFRPIQWSIALMALIGIPFVVYGSWRTAARLVAPVLQLDRAAERLARGEREVVVIPGEDEIARLAKRFNAMAGEIEERENRISQLAYYDSLTGLPNRVKFQQAVAQRLEEPRDEAGNLALLCLDLDDFKGVNDTLGHGAGDELLRTVALRLSQFAKGEFVARLGGDEFVVMLENGGSRAAIEQFAEELVAMMRRPLEINSHQIVPSISIGIALAGPDGEDAEIVAPPRRSRTLPRQGGGPRQLLLFRGKLQRKGAAAPPDRGGSAPRPRPRANWNSIISRCSISRPTASALSRRCCAGIIPNGASSVPPNSSRSPKTPA